MSETKCYHFRINFYADEDRKSLIHSGFSLLDPRRWFIVNSEGKTEPIDSKGVTVSLNSSINIKYKPEILPISLLSEQGVYSDISSANDRPILCGVTYYVDVDYYTNDGFQNFSQFEYRIPCFRTKDRFWRKNTDAIGWISSANGRTDLRVSHTQFEALKPVLDANYRGTFLISWQDFRSNQQHKENLKHTSQIFYGFYDSESDKFWTSGQGFYDNRAISKGFLPLIHANFDNNFYLSSYDKDQVYAFTCDMNPSSMSIDGCVLSGSKSININKTVYDEDHFLKSRVYEKDVKGSYVLSSGNTVPVVDNCISRLEISGPPGSHAVRARNENDRDWSDWIIIDTDSNSSGNVSSLLRAYSIDNERFVLPWQLSSGNGLKRVCMQILTYYGVTSLFCQDVLLQQYELSYRVELSYNSDFSSSLTKYEEYPVVSAEDSEGNTRTVYVKVIFDDKDSHDKLESYLTDLGESFNLTFNVIQQGVYDQFGLPLNKIGEQDLSEGVSYSGSFTLDNSDGVFVKDGVASIVVNIPNPCLQQTSQTCNVSNIEEGLYNLRSGLYTQDSYVSYLSFIDDISPDKLLDHYSKSGLGFISNSKKMDEFYDKDDPRFNFGKPDLYKNSS